MSIWRTETEVQRDTRWHWLVRAEAWFIAALMLLAAVSAVEGLIGPV